MNTMTMKLKVKPPAPAWPYLARTMKPASPSERFDNMAPAAIGAPACVVYAAACPGLQSLAMQARCALHKVGVTTVDLRYRLRQMSMDRYGSLHLGSDGLVSSPGFDDWSAQPLHVSLPLSDASPVCVANRGLRVMLPDGLTARDFDRQLARALASISARVVAETTAGGRFCSELGVDPATLQRVTAYDFGGPLRHSASSEIAFFRPRLDGDHLVVVIERSWRTILRGRGAI